MTVLRIYSGYIALATSALGCSLLFGPSAPSETCQEGLTLSPAGSCVVCANDGDCSAGEFCDRRVYGCVSQAESVFLAPNGVDPASPTSGDCTFERPCATVDVALELASSQKHHIVLLEGRYQFGQINLDGALLPPVGISLVGSPLAILEIGTGDDSALIRITNEARVSLVSLEIERSDGSGGGAYGIECINSELEVRESSVSFSNDAAGIRTLRCNASVLASTISHNQTGLLVESGDLEMMSSLVVENSGSDTGGLELRRCRANEPECTASTQDITIVFSTVADNGGNEVGGVRCADLSGPIFAVGNIVQDNAGPVNIGEERDGALSTLEQCIFSESIAAEIGPSEDPVLFEAGYELQAGSPGVDVLALSSVLDRADIDIDLDGDPRSRGAAPDMGAQERPAEWLRGPFFV